MGRKPADPPRFVEVRDLDQAKLYIDALLENRARDRLQLFFSVFPETRGWTHSDIGINAGLARETVTRTLGEL